MVPNVCSCLASLARVVSSRLSGMFNLRQTIRVSVDARARGARDSLRDGIEPRSRTGAAIFRCGRCDRDERTHRDTHVGMPFCLVAMWGYMGLVKNIENTKYTQLLRIEYALNGWPLWEPRIDVGKFYIHMVEQSHWICSRQFQVEIWTLSFELFTFTTEFAQKFEFFILTTSTLPAQRYTIFPPSQLTYYPNQS